MFLMREVKSHLENLSRFIRFGQSRLPKRAEVIFCPFVATFRYFGFLYLLMCLDTMVWSELQKRADRADQSVLIFLAGANFWEKHAKNCAFMSMAHSTYTIAH